MTIYKGCPYCDAVFEIGPEDDWPLREHLLDIHTDPTRRGGSRHDGSRRSDSAQTTPRSDPTRDWPVEALGWWFRTTDDADEVRRLALAVLHGHSISDRQLADWFGFDVETIRRLREEVEAADSGQA
jgi:hypothetical protein